MHEINPTTPGLPSTGFLRLRQIAGKENSLFPICERTWWRWIEEGRAPRPVKIGPNSTAWAVEDIRDLIEKLKSQEKVAA